MLHNIKMILEYDGTRYKGFQIQKDLDTIQKRLEDCLSTILRKKIRIKYASRTDAGVHAKEQVINFTTESEIDYIKLQRSMNAILPSDIVVKHIEEVATDFNSRRDAKSREYEYYILNKQFPSAFNKNYLLINKKLNIKSMILASKYLIGEKDFRSFCKDSSEIENTVRNVKEVEINKAGDFIVIRIIANSFIHQMVRIIVGTLIEVGLSKREPYEISQILEKKERAFAGKAVEARGLYLTKINY